MRKFLEDLIRLLGSGLILASVALGFIPTLASAAAQASCATELVGNGGFEVPAVTSTQLWEVVPGGQSGVVWQAEWVNQAAAAGKPVIANVELHKGWSAQNGSQFTELDSDFDGVNTYPLDAASVSLFQDIPTQAGKQYSVVFYTSPMPGRGILDNVIEFGWNGAVIATIVEDGSTRVDTVWTRHEYALAATSASTRISFTDRGISDSFGSALDSVSVYETCPPVTGGGSVAVSSGGGSSASLVPAVLGNTASKPLAVNTPALVMPEVGGVSELPRTGFGAWAIGVACFVVFGAFLAVRRIVKV